MRSLGFVAVFSCAFANAQPAAVDLGYASYHSELSLTDGVTSFLGIRYAASPAGDQRWRAPQPPSKVPGVQNATSPPPQCHHVPLAGSPGISTTSPFRNAYIDELPGVCVPAPFRISYPKVDVAPYSEDCLFLNVHVPSEWKAQSLPVIVFIHGGGYDAGSASLYPVQDFVALSDFGVVAVGLQYRLGVFGFLSGSKVKESGNLNVGLLDQNFALQWIQKHISSFGGDPAKVTIWGQSAGAGGMLQHIVAHGGNTQPPLFHTVIANSPFLPPQYQYDDPVPEALYSAVVSHVGCESLDNSMMCLRGVDGAALLAAGTYIGASSFLGTFTFLPVVDGAFITERPTETLQRGQVNGEMLLLTTNADEGALFVNPDALVHNNITLHAYTRGLFPRLDPAQVEQVVKLYSNIGLGSIVDQASEIMGDSIFVCPTYYIAAAFKLRAWKAQFAVPPGLHGQDLSYIFSTFAVPPTVTDPAFLDAFRQSFMAAAITQNPNTRLRPSMLPPWSAWGETQSEMRFLQSDSGLIVQPFVTDDGELERCEFWRSIAQVNSQ
ncbi:Alpha/Beta hydrolase protein [Mycena maculata]|uniref:Carboxylic ester hydrolase n=1 Tax=Mycena maculata TaxID=230809 RepID=A0AAD7MVF5_9AGAR|nr:Alpha/Beta hydrolase protein [Mycena maculata]